MPDPIPTADVQVLSLFNNLTLPTPCDPLTKLIMCIECVGGVWQPVLIDSEQFLAWLGIDPVTRMKKTDKPCCGQDEQSATNLE